MCNHDDISYVPCPELGYIPIMKVDRSNTFTKKTHQLAAIQKLATNKTLKTATHKMEDAVNSGSVNRISDAIQDMVYEMRKSSKVVINKSLIEDLYSLELVPPSAVSALGKFAGSTVETAVKAILEESLRDGASRVTVRTFLDAFRSTDKVVTNMSNTIDFYMNYFGENKLAPLLHEKIDTLLRSGEQVTGDTFRLAMKEALDHAYNESWYWKTVANNSASRSYHYGLTKSAQIIGHTRYRLVAVIDDKTTDICRALDGKEFLIQDAVQHLEFVTTLLEEELPLQAPFPTIEQVEGKSSNDLTNDKILSPPFHFGCRTTLITYT